MPNNDNKERITVWMNPSVIKKCDANRILDNCASRSDFIENAVNFYSGYIASENNTDFLATVISQTLRGIIKSSEDRIARLQFKEAVELAKIVRMIAPLCRMKEGDLHQIHIECVDEVKRINGVLKLDSVLRGEL